MKESRYPDRSSGQADTRRFDRNYNVDIAAEACASVAPGLLEFAVQKILPRIARVRQTAEIIEAIRSPMQTL